jgi:hypothetical protein
MTVLTSLRACSFSSACRASLVKVLRVPGRKDCALLDVSGLWPRTEREAHRQAAPDQQPFDAGLDKNLPCSPIDEDIPIESITCRSLGHHALVGRKGNRAWECWGGKLRLMISIRRLPTSRPRSGRPSDSRINIPLNVELVPRPLGPLEDLD